MILLILGIMLIGVMLIDLKLAKIIKILNKK